MFYGFTIREKERKGMYNFRKLEATNHTFRSVANEYNSYLDSFRLFASRLTVIHGKTRSGKSGKADSYTRYLIRLFIFVKEHVKDESIRMDSLSFFNQLKHLQQDSDFKTYNENERRFPNASINCFYQFWLNLAFEEDDYFNNNIDSANENSRISQDDIKIESMSKPDKVKINGKYSYIRSVSSTSSAKTRSNRKCEFDEYHTTFISKDSNLPFIEAHHMIPISLQDNFKYSLDVIANIVCLCPNCHRRIHYSIDEEKEEILRKIYLIREDELKRSEIWISYSDFLSLYNI
jgi:5-methylcytosine-specific restriction enzyme A